MVSVYANKIKRFGNGKQKSEKDTCFLALMLNMVKDIKNYGYQKATNKKNSPVGGQKI